MAKMTRLDKSVKNARINLTFYVIIIFISFFSRRIFLDFLGEEFVGLTSTLISVLGMINIAELGIGGAVGFMLYKPLYQDNKMELNEIISIFGYVYRKIGVIVIAIALLLSPLLPIYLKSSDISNWVIFYAYFSYVFVSILGYFINYKQLLLNADQRNYEIMICFQSTNIIRLLVQIVIAYYTKNVFFWITTEIIFGCIYSYVISKRVHKVYPWLNSNIKNGKALLKKYPKFIKNVKQIFIHNISGITLVNISPLIIASWSLSQVALYNNYSLIVSKVTQLIAQLMGSNSAGIGNVIAEGDSHLIKRVYWEINSLYYFIAGTITISLYFIVDPFISIWIGESYIMDTTTVSLILIILYLSLIRAANDSFIYAYGLFYDTWAPITETVLTVVASIIGGYYFGINGVLFGTIIGVIPIVHVWKPYFLFSQGINSSFFNYLKTIFKYIILALIVFIVMIYLVEYISFERKNSYLWWSLTSLIIFSTTTVLMGSAMLLTSLGMRSATKRVIGLILKKIK